MTGCRGAFYTLVSVLDLVRGDNRKRFQPRTSPLNCIAPIIKPGRLGVPHKGGGNECQRRWKKEIHFWFSFYIQLYLINKINNCTFFDFKLSAF